MDFQQVFNQTHRTSNYIIKTNNYTQDTISIDMQIGLDIIYARNKERKKKKRRTKQLKPLLPSTSRSGIDYFSRAQLTG